MQTYINRLHYANVRADLLYSFSNTQRPGAVYNMTMEEFEGREVEVLEGRRITTIIVVSHKTGSKGGAVLRLEHDLASQLDQWVGCLRPVILPASCPLVFSNSEGLPITHFSSKMAALGKTLGFDLPLLSEVRKVVVTLSAEKASDYDRDSLAQHMCHSLATSRRFYDVSEAKLKKAKGYLMSSAIIHQSKQEPCQGPARRRAYTKGEEELICTHFSESISQKKAPAAMMAKEFLQLYPNSFQGRSNKDIIDKVRSIIRRGKDE